MNRLPRPGVFEDWASWGSRLVGVLESTFDRNPGDLDEFTLAWLPDTRKHRTRLIYVSDATGGAVPAYSDGTNWRRVTDGTVID